MAGCTTVHMCLSRRLTSLGIVFALALIIFAIFTPVAAAAGTPDKLIVFTDKNVYLDWYIDNGQNANLAVDWKSDNTPAQTPYVYAIILDDDGNMMKSQTISVNIKDIARLDHFDKGIDTIHHARNDTNGAFFNINVNLYDNAANGDKVDGDGIYSYQWTPSSRFGTILLDDHLMVNITVTSGSLSANTTILFSWMNCHKGEQTSHPGTHSLSEGVSGADPCTMCHVGYGHFYENKSNLIPEIKKDVHFGRMNPIVPAMGGKAAPDWEWNLTAKENGNGYGTTAWDVIAPGSEYCYWCHFSTSGGDYLDYDAGSGFRSDANDRPSCSQASVTLSLGTVTCHATTEITGTSVPSWNPSSAATGGSAGSPNNNIVDAESHNSTSATQGEACAICHGSTHNLAMPNMAVDISSTGDLSNQCIFCHDIADGSINTVPHDPSKTNCNSCHKNGTGVLDAHEPTASSGGRDCGTCHNISGTAGYDLDITNVGAGAHANLNNGATSTGGNATYAKCWACHGNLSDGDADEADQPAEGHPSSYKTPRTCPDCHVNTVSLTNFSAPQVTEHREGAPTVPTNGTLCSVCHNNSLTSIDENDGFGLSGSEQNASTSHYLTNVSLMTASNRSDDCRWCHILNNGSTLWGTPFDPLGNPSHSTDIATNDKCYSCHGELSAGVVFHDSGITKGGSGGQDCVSCHEGTTGNNVHVATMNLSDSIHVNLNNLGTEVGRVENKMCYACHTNDSY
ncbi:MAG: hypothetical protein KAH86_04735, partial [Methanosarcinales archaeon]|nr:hypothetical protein [Methanosarcinales archaeon]